MEGNNYEVISIPDHQWNPQNIYGHLLDVALPIVEAYRSDFYHDAMRVRETYGITDNYFYYVGKCGTYLLEEHNPMYGHHGRDSWFKVVKVKS